MYGGIFLSHPLESYQLPTPLRDQKAPTGQRVSDKVNDKRKGGGDKGIREGIMERGMKGK